MKNGDGVIQAVGLSKKFNDQYVVENLNLNIRSGQIFGFIGPSGSGKTSTVRLLTGYYFPSEGSAKIFDHNATELSETERSKIGYMPQLFALYKDLSIWENLNFVASLYGMGFFRAKKLKRLLEFTELDEHRRKLTSQISGGMQRRLSLAAALVHNPEVLFLDEPTAGVDPVLRRKFWDYFAQLRTDGKTLFVTTQYVSEAAYCDWLGVLSEGKLLYLDTPEGLRKRAYGGDVIHIAVPNGTEITTNYLHELASLPYVRESAGLLNENSIRIVVNESSTAIPHLMEFSKARRIDVQSIEQFNPPFDDVFVHLIQKEEA
jgi:ABC-2 type transport system ATP-binding protein